MQRLDAGWPKHVGGLERQLEQVVLGLALDPRPHQLAVLGRIGTAPADVGEHHVWVQPCQRACRGQGDVVGQATIALLAHAERGNAEAEESRVVARQLRLQRRKVEEILVQDLAKLGVALSGGAAPDCEHTIHARVEQAFAQHALPDHAGGAEQDDLHPSIRRMPARDGIAALRR